MEGMRRLSSLGFLVLVAGLAACSSKNGDEGPLTSGTNDGSTDGFDFDSNGGGGVNDLPCFMQISLSPLNAVV
jgi:hypothetical protein